MVPRVRSVLTLVTLLAALVAGGRNRAVAQGTPRPVDSRVLQQVALGALPAPRYAMKATMLTMQPGARIPPHVHGGPGLRYVLDGAITIVWKDGRSETFRAGSTYFEGPGENHPAGTISARNDGTTVCRVLIVELASES